jgi:DNA-binding NtrC family response regulator
MLKPKTGDMAEQELLVVDDEQSICWGLQRLGESIGLRVATAHSIEEAWRLAPTIAPQAILVDVRLPGQDGLSAMDEMRQRFGNVPIIVITAHGDLSTAVDAVRNGAFEYISKPFQLDHVQQVIERALAVKLSVPQIEPIAASSGLVGKSAAIQAIFKQIALASCADASVLLGGESGTGKELAARAIHKYSPRAAGPFVAVNVAALSESLAESELFGHVRGAFTGADSERVGLLVRANGGTLFLDEVADIPLATQVKLLRVLEHGEVTPVGGSKPVQTNFRVIAATHQDLLQKVKAGSFRHDLFFRLCAFRIDIPPLRERGEDIRELAEYFLELLARGKAGKRLALSSDALQELLKRPWYGNVRELRNAIEHAVIVCRAGTIEAGHLPPALNDSFVNTQTPTLDSAEAVRGALIEWTQKQLNRDSESQNLYAAFLSLVEPPLLEQALKKTHGQCATAARRLGMHRTTLKKKLDEYGITSND